MSEASKEFVSLFQEPEFRQLGSSLKFMLVAEGIAHVYPRLAPTMEVGGGGAVAWGWGGRCGGLKLWAVEQQLEANQAATALNALSSMQPPL